MIFEQKLNGYIFFYDRENGSLIESTKMEKIYIIRTK